MDLQFDFNISAYFTDGKDRRTERDIVISTTQYSNVAQDGVATQSDTWEDDPDRGADKAIDGNINGDWWK